MLLFCPNCGRRFEVPGHIEADAAQKCPSCGVEFGGTRRESASGGRLKFVSGGETHYEVASPRATGDSRAPLAEAVRAKPARRVDPAKCELVRELGRSGAGIVYEGRDAESGEPVIVRKLLVEGGSVADAERWSAAAAKLQNLRHPRVVSILGVGLREGTPHLVAERAAGRNLGACVAGRPMAIRQAAQHALQVVEALTAAQGAGAVHGDLKPSNVIVDPQGRARVCDFGLAPRALEAGELVPSPHVLGWLPFAAPELVREGPALADERSDSYGLGALLYFMLTGCPPFREDDPRALLASVLEEMPRPPSSLNPKIPAELDAVVMRALEKNPTFRPANVQAVGLELRRFEREPQGAVVARGVPGFHRRRSWPRVVLALVLLGAAGGGGYWFYRRHTGEAAHRNAQTLVEEARRLERTPGGLPEAVDRYRRAAEVSSGYPFEAEFLLFYAGSLVRAGDPSSAAEVLEKASRLRSDEAVEARAWLPAVLVLKGSLAEAESAWRKLATSDAPPAALGRSGERALEAAEVLVRSRRAEEARKMLESLLQMDALLRAAPSLESELRSSLARALVELGNLDDARVQLGRVLAAGERVPLAVRERAAVALAELASSQELQRELSAEEEGAISFSALARALYARTLAGRHLASGPKTASAETAVSRASAWASEVASSSGSPALARAWANLVLGETSEAAGKFDDSRARFEAARAIASGLPSEEGAPPESLALVGLARLALRAGDARTASAGLREVSRRFGGDTRCSEAAAAAILLEGHAQRLLGQVDEAARRYRELVDSFAGVKQVHAAVLSALCGLGEVAMEMRAGELAQSNFEKLRMEGPSGVLGVVARAMTGGATEAELVEAVALASSDEAARALYCVALKRDLANERGPAQDLLRKAIEAAGESSWYRFLAGSRLERR